MAGEWIKMRCDLHDDPAVFRIAALLKIDPYAVIGRLHTFWGWADRHSVDGVVDGVVVADVDSIVRLEGFTDALVKAGWLEVTESGIKIPKFDRHNGESAKKRALKNERQARWRAGKDADEDEVVDSKASTDTSTSVSTREEKRREEEKHMSASAADVLDYLNQKAGRKFEAVPANTKLITARIKEGATVEQLKAVVDAKVIEWGSNPKMEQYLRPETLFGATKYAQYAGSLGTAANGHETSIFG